jgi:hypothetical protein
MRKWQLAWPSRSRSAPPSPTHPNTVTKKSAVRQPRIRTKRAQECYEEGSTMEGHMPKATRLAHRLAREDTLKGRSTMVRHVPKTPRPYTSEEIMAGATIVAAMLQTGKLPVPNLRSDFADIAEAVTKCASAISEARHKPRHSVSQPLAPQHQQEKPKRSPRGLPLPGMPGSRR